MVRHEFMPIQFNHKLRRINGAIQLKESLGNKDDALIAWWYSGLYKNRKDSSQPYALVAFRKITSDAVSDEIVYKRISLVALGQVRIGSVWRNDRCVAEANFTTERFQVDFTFNSWRFTSFGKASKNNEAPPFPQDLYDLQRPEDWNWLIEFGLANGGKLLIPCVEFFSRCFGRSSELKRILATYSWDGQGDTAKNRLYAAIDKPEEQGKWQVRLRRRLVNGDVIFLAHAKYDNYTERVAKSIYSQIEANHDPKEIKPAFIKVAPWFQGLAELKVEGVTFNEGKSFLALRVMGMSDPQGATVLRGRENSRDAENPAPEGSPEAWAGVPKRALLKFPDIVDLTGDEAPDRDSGAIEVQDVGFEILGEARSVIDVKTEQATTKAGEKAKAPDLSTISGGETHGSGKGVGHASIHAKPIFESNGMLRDMWDAMHRLQTTKPELIQSVKWFTFEDKFSSEPTPKLIALEPFKEDDIVSSTARRFPYMDPSIPTLRGILVAQLSVLGKLIYIVEIMRRPKKISSEDGEVQDAEEAFQGMVFCLDNEDKLTPWLRKVIAQIPYVNGVFRRITQDCPGIADSFSHRLSSNLSDGCLPCEHIVLGAIAKLKT